ncbi:MAG TPA: DUF4388 domain-containing protein [Chitinispirillaceae bacterium]|jgi:hypothetical protein|nr:DUF4388 domain-containing protein [Chitinispirillaceae bacterium]
MDLDFIWVSAAGLGTGSIAGILLFLAFRLRKKPEMMTGQYNTSFVFSGNLKQTNLLDAIQFLEIGRREGILHIYCGRRKGYLTFKQGQVVDAFYRNETGREAIFEMLELPEGDFYFEPKLINQPRLMSESMMDIAFEWDARKNGGLQE